MLHVNQLIGFGAGGVSSSIQFVGGKTATKAAATSGTSTIALNSGLTGGIASAVSNGDFVIAVFAAATATDRTLSITDGANPYTLIGSELYADDTMDANLRVAYKVISGDTATTFGPTGGTAEAAAMAVYVFRGVNVANPIDVTPTTATGINSVLANPPSILPVTPGAFIVCAAAGAHFSQVDTFTSSDLSAFFTDGFDGTSNDATVGIGHYPNWEGGAFDAAQFGFSSADNTSASWAAISCALRPS